MSDRDEQPAAGFLAPDAFTVLAWCSQFTDLHSCWEWGGQSVLGPPLRTHIMGAYGGMCKRVVRRNDYLKKWCGDHIGLSDCGRPPRILTTGPFKRRKVFSSANGTQVLKAQRGQKVGILEVRLEASEVWLRTWENGMKGTSSAWLPQPGVMQGLVTQQRHI